MVGQQGRTDRAKISLGQAVLSEPALTLERAKVGAVSEIKHGRPSTRGNNAALLQGPDLICSQADFGQHRIGVLTQRRRQAMLPTR